MRPVLQSRKTSAGLLPPLGIAPRLLARMMFSPVGASMPTDFFPGGTLSKLLLLSLTAAPLLLVSSPRSLGSLLWPCRAEKSVLLNPPPRQDL
jgi:hypothetical protein